MQSQAGRFDAQYYKDNYRNYAAQNPPSKMAFYRSLVERHVQGKNAARILDLGCAFGVFLKSLGDEWQRFGVDVSEFAIGRASKAVLQGRFAVASCTAVPFRARFDAVVAFDVIEHVEDFDRVAPSVQALLADDGIFVFVVPVYDGPFGPLVHLLDHDPTHVQKKARKFWLSWTRRHFELVEWTGVFRYLLPGGPYLHWPTQMLRRVAPAIAVVARKRR